MKKRGHRKRNAPQFPRKPRNDLFEDGWTAEQIREVLDTLRLKGCAPALQFLKQRHGLTVSVGSLYRFRARCATLPAAVDTTILSEIESELVGLLVKVRALRGLILQPA